VGFVFTNNAIKTNSYGAIRQKARSDPARSGFLSRITILFTAQAYRSRPYNTHVSIRENLLVGLVAFGESTNGLENLSHF
jgi:hypothetical protein